MTEIDYGRFHERLEHARRAGTTARWELLREFQRSGDTHRPDGRADRTARTAGLTVDAPA